MTSQGRGHEAPRSRTHRLVIDPYFSGRRSNGAAQRRSARPRRLRHIAPGSSTSCAARTSPTSRISRNHALDISEGQDEELCSLLGVDPAHSESALLLRGLRDDRISSARFPSRDRRDSRPRSSARPASARRRKNPLNRSFVLLNTGRRAPTGRGVCGARSPGDGRDHDYALEASVLVTGAAVQCCATPRPARVAA